LFWLSGFVLLVAYGCSSKKRDVSDTPNQGTIYISVEQSFRPVIEQQIRMYEDSYPGTHIVAAYKPEAECLRDFFNDSITRMAIVSRALTPDEDRAMKKKLGYLPGCQQVASDAVVLILHPNRKDSLFTLDGLRNALSGKGNGNIFVFDGQRATGTVRYIRDSILKGGMYDPTNVGAKKSATEVIDFVAKNENAIGFVGISEIGNPEDSVQASMRKLI
jgi:phosphate transport system substrate-binding protein